MTETIRLPKAKIFTFCPFKKKLAGVPIVAQRVRNLTGIYEDALASLSGLIRIPSCHKLRCRSQMQLGSGVAVAVA